MENVANRKSSHSVHQLHVHIVWSTKYRYGVMRGEVQIRCRDLIRQMCDTMDIRILKGVVSKDHIHLHISYPPKLSISEIVKRLKGRSARLLMDEFVELKKRYWGQHLWGIGYGAWSSGNITDEMIQNYLEHHRDNPNSDENFILE
ncbi:MAG: IS200/IS605 family transposase [Sphingobacteriia bacterium]|jgi:putative transposase|nr:IS200/IS605 family transposase [Sphingobacteriia bacterium]MCO5290352.1 IS200/IS605 family transposase [Chitinophagaceae bacterium]MCO5290821.1 IS200/IS605 family transposase [Chitinophagaceae bacterium]MCO5290875.1 IS200/IS605 family transposase [Chitinophagaceae bacterium]MCO5291321.1 IS200/IS605 family transposase [Chitinophagaceae bacterium]